MTLIEDKKALKENTGALMVIQILNYVLPFITLPYVARIFRVSDYGVIFYAQVLMDYFWRFIMFGFDLSAVRQIAIHSNSKRCIKHIFSSVLIVQIIFIFVGLLILSLIVFCIPKFTKDWLIYYFTYFGTIGTIFSFNWFYQGIAKMKFITLLNIITRSISLILIFTFIKVADDYILYPLLNASATITAGIISIIFVKKYFNISLYLPKLKTIWKTIKYSSEFFLTKVSIAIYRQTNAFILGLLLSSTMVAYYVAADRIFWAVLSLYFTFINALFPYMSKNKDIVFFKKIFKYLIIFSIGASIFLFFVSKYIILIFYSAKYTNAIHILQIFSLSFAFYVFVDTLGFPLLGAFGYIKETNRCYILGGIYNIVGLIILYFTHCLNIYSVAILVSTTYFVMFLHRIYCVHKYKLLVNINKKEVIQCL